MSKDTIYREDAIKALKLMLSDDINTSILFFWQNQTVGRGIDKIKNLPSADRPQGEWIRIEWNENIEGHIVPMRIYKCSTCGEKEVALTRFCPNCGADMREREGE